MKSVWWEVWEDRVLYSLHKYQDPYKLEKLIPMKSVNCMSNFITVHSDPALIAAARVYQSIFMGLQKHHGH